MDTFGDSTFSRHIAVSKVLGLATLRLANSLILPLNLTSYSSELGYYSSKIHALVASLPSCQENKLGLSALDKAIQSVQTSTGSLQIEIESIETRLDHLSSISSTHHGEDKREGHHHHKGEKKIIKLMKEIRIVNKKLREFESGFIDVEGLPGRKWYRSLVVAPGRDLGYGQSLSLSLTLFFLSNLLTFPHQVPRLSRRLLKV